MRGRSHDYLRRWSQENTSKENLKKEDEETY
jgi:hypothetical protein